MPKGIGYQDASKLSSSGRRKSEDEKSLKKTKRTESIIRGLIQAGFTREEAEARVDKKKKGKK
ncbi:hypothetical protein LCGC14_1709940 [marine sediment metagenome]|uniref:Uncharacterized protein n=1 Tax=marine sediment metagenome TaxID=412755 RepID=A0A0F9HG46_9ZZZZ